MGFRIYQLIILVSASSILLFSMETTSVHGHPRCKRHRHHKDCSSSSSSDARKNCCCCSERKSKMCPADSTTSAIPLVTNPGVDIFRPSSIQRSSFISLLSNYPIEKFFPEKHYLQTIEFVTKILSLYSKHRWPTCCSCYSGL